MVKGILVLEDGTVFYGEGFGATGERTGEVVFNTGLTGYQEVLTDPSYKGQIVTMTYPHIGNCGVNDRDVESAGVHVEGFVVREFSAVSSNWRAQRSLEEFLEEHQVVGLTEVDTRALTRHIRSRGAMRGVISTRDDDVENLLARARQWPGLVGRDLVREVTSAGVRRWEQGTPAPWREGDAVAGRRFHVVVYDFGVKHNILRCLGNTGCQVTVVPASTPAQDVLELNPDGVLLSNGPGDPEGVPYAIAAIRELGNRKPLFGICLGHQLMALAWGGRTYKMKFGHRGSNQPVKNLQTGRVEITAQNHGFAVAAESLGEEVEITHINLNDGTVEGMRHREWPAFGVQYHPEASAGPHDARYLFGTFVRMMEARAR